MTAFRWILTWAPATAWVVLAGVWITSAFVCGVMFICLDEFALMLSTEPGTACARFEDSYDLGYDLETGFDPAWGSGLSKFAGAVRVGIEIPAAAPADCKFRFSIGVPFLFLLTLLLPLAVGPFTRFRFGLRHYCVYTGLIALELAYYSQ